MTGRPSSYANNRTDTSTTKTIEEATAYTAIPRCDSCSLAEQNRQSVILFISFLLIMTALDAFVRFYCKRFRQLAHPVSLNPRFLENQDNCHQKQQHKQELEERYLMIESSLINMIVLNHDDNICPDHQAEEGRCTGDSKFVPTDATSLYQRKHFCHQEGKRLNFCVHDQQKTDPVNDPMTCSICLDHFGAHDIISISPKYFSSCLSSNCRHVFHHVCIKEWLLQHSTCPSCRQDFFCNDTILDDDTYVRSTTNYSNGKTNHSIVYCIQHGIIFVNQTMEQNGTDRTPTASPTKEELMLLRLHKTKLDIVKNSNEEAIISDSFDDEWC